MTSWKIIIGGEDHEIEGKEVGRKYSGFGDSDIVHIQPTTPEGAQTASELLEPTSQDKKGNPIYPILQPRQKR